MNFSVWKAFSAKYLIWVLRTKVLFDESLFVLATFVFPFGNISHCKYSHESIISGNLEYVCWNINMLVSKIISLSPSKCLINPEKKKISNSYARMDKFIFDELFANFVVLLRNIFQLKLPNCTLCLSYMRHSHSLCDAAISKTIFRYNNFDSWVLYLFEPILTGRNLKMLK